MRWLLDVALRVSEWLQEVFALPPGYAAGPTGHLMWIGIEEDGKDEE